MAYASEERRKLSNMWWNAKRRAKEQGVVFAIKEEFLFDLIPEKCPCCGKTLDFFDGTLNDRPALDRLIPDLGYVERNLWVLCGECNARKLDSAPEDLYRIADIAYAEIKRRGLRDRS